MPEAPLVGSVESGGTKFECTEASGPTDVRDELRYWRVMPQVWQTEAAGHATQLAKQATAQGSSLVIAAGGDGLDVLAVGPGARLAAGLAQMGYAALRSLA